jgi:hypothetical protein
MNALWVFVSLMNGVFWQYLDKFVQGFLDNILIYFHMLEDHKEHLRKLL